MLLDNRPAHLRTIEVEVTEEDIERARASHHGWISRRCALAQALKRQTGEVWSCSYGLAAPVGSGREYKHDGERIVSAYDAGFNITGRVRLTPIQS